MSVTVETPTVSVTDWMTARFAAVGGALAGINVYVAAADQDQPRPVAGAAGPYITLRHLGSSDTWRIGARRGHTTTVIEVTAWDEGTDTSRLRPIVAAIQTALHRQRGFAGDARISTCIRAAPVERQIVEGKKLFTQLGGEYRARLTRP